MLYLAVLFFFFVFFLPKNIFGGQRLYNSFDSVKAQHYRIFFCKLQLVKFCVAAKVQTNDKCKMYLIEGKSTGDLQQGVTRLDTLNEDISS